MSIGALAPNSTMLGGASIGGGSGPGARAVAGGRSRTLLGSAGGGGSNTGPNPPRERGPVRPGPGQQEY
jgi:hypothetical protein